MQTTFHINEKDLSMTFEVKNGEGKITANWSTVSDFRPYLCYGEETIELASASSITSKPYKSGVGSGLAMTFEGFKAPAEGLSFTTLVWVEDATGIVRFELIPLTEAKTAPTAIHWPGPLEFNDGSASSYTLLNFEQGVMIPNNWPVKTEKASFEGTLNTAGAYMPWFAQIREDKNAYIAICETPWNAAYNVYHPENGPYTHMHFRFEPSLGKMDYRRIVQLRFLEEADVTKVCKTYREYAIETGKFRSLKEKAAANPEVEDLVGCCFVHAGIKTKVQPNSDFFDPEDPGKNDNLTPFKVREEMVKTIQKTGVEKMYLHLDGWAQPGYDNCHPDYWPICEEAGGAKDMKSLVDTMHRFGYLFGIHDQYRDYYRTAECFDEEFACRLPDGTIPEHAHWAGGPQSYLCGTQAPYFVTRNFSRLKEAGIDLDGAYLDVFTCNEGDECDNPMHRMSRRDCYEMRGRCFRYLSAHHILPSSEEVNDWAMTTQVFCHYAPYDFQLAEPGTPKRGIPAPLFNLVYHECVIEPFMMDIVSAENGKKEDYMLYAVLNGQAPYLIRDAAYMNIDGAFVGEGMSLEEAKDRCDLVQQLHEEVGMLEMTRFDLLSEDGTKQQTTFADGTTVTIDLKEQTFLIKGGKAE